MSDPTPLQFSRFQLSELAAPGSDTFVDGPFGSSLKSHEYVDTGVRLIQLQNIGEGEWRDQNKKFITSRKFKTLERHGAVPGDIAIAKMADPVARACIVPAVSEQFLVVADCIRLRLDESRFDAGYVVRAINSPYTRHEAERKAIGSTRVRINLSVLKTVGCLAPPLPAQKEITRILDTLDTAIHETEAIIAKLKAVKQGLLHDLLTRGIDANGELRPSQAEAPHLYKESPLGWIPTEWDFDAIENFLDRIIDYRGRTPEKTESGVPLITAKNVRLGYIDPEPREFIALENFEPWMSRGIPRKGDVLFTTEAPLGNVAQIETNDRLAFAQRMIILQTGSRLVNSFLKYLLLGMPFRARLVALGSGSTVEGIQQSTFRKILVTIPGSLEEQSSIVEMLINMDSKINYELSSIEKLKQTKSGLMDDLLTGRVRVTPLLEGAAP